MTTSNERFVVLSALLDREPVDPDLLAAALEDPEGRGQLVDFVRIRWRIGDDLALNDRATPTIRRVPFRTRIWLARAALILLPLLAGAAGGAWFVDRQDSRPPTPTRVVQFVQGVDWK
jgi:hypothetical protein